MIVYNSPGRTGVDMTVAEISGHRNIVGIKDASGDLSRVSAYRQLCGKDFLLYT